LLLSDSLSLEDALDFSFFSELLLLLLLDDEELDFSFFASSSLLLLLLLLLLDEDDDFEPDPLALFFPDSLDELESAGFAFFAADPPLESFALRFAPRLSSHASTSASAPPSLASAPAASLASTSVRCAFSFRSLRIACTVLFSPHARRYSSTGASNGPSRASSTALAGGGAIVTRRPFRRPLAPARPLERGRRDREASRSFARVRSRPRARPRPRVARVGRGMRRRDRAPPPRGRILAANQSTSREPSNES
jgi:hypothetical protein